MRLLLLLWLLFPLTVHAQDHEVLFLATATDEAGAHQKVPKELVGDATIGVRMQASKGNVTVLAAVFDKEHDLLGDAEVHSLSEGQQKTLSFSIPAQLGHRLYLVMFDPASAELTEIQKVQKNGGGALHRRVARYLNAQPRLGRGGPALKEIGGVVTTSASAANPPRPLQRQKENKKVEEVDGEAAADSVVDWRTSPNVLRQSFSAKEHPVVRYSLNFAEQRAVLWQAGATDKAGLHGDVPKRLSPPATIEVRLKAEKGPVTAVGVLFDEESALVAPRRILSLRTGQEAKLQVRLPDRRNGRYRYCVLLLDSKSPDVVEATKGEDVALVKLLARVSAQEKNERGGELRNSGPVVSTASTSKPGTLHGDPAVPDRKYMKNEWTRRLVFSTNRPSLLRFPISI